jgi:Fe-S cluster biogenesis protein NfuA
MTMKAGVEETLRKVMPQLNRVDAINVDATEVS